jgi:hypothetical protein
MDLKMTFIVLNFIQESKLIFFFGHYVTAKNLIGAAVSLLLLGFVGLGAAVSLLRGGGRCPKSYVFLNFNLKNF